MNQTTKTFAAKIGIEAESIRVRVCRTGSYFGIVPVKLINGRLLWPADAVERLVAQRAKNDGGQRHA